MVSELKMLVEVSVEISGLRGVVGHGRRKSYWTADVTGHKLLSSLSVEAAPERGENIKRFNINVVF